MNEIPALMHPAFVRVYIPSALATGFDYILPEGISLEPGDWVRVPLGKRLVTGVVWAVLETPDVAPEKLKPVTQKYVFPPLSKAQRTFIDWVAHYTLNPVGQILSMVLSVPQVFDELKTSRKTITIDPLTYQAPTLSSDQEVAVKILTKLSQETSEKRPYPLPILLEGVTGSGKTEVYFSQIARILDKGQQVLVMVPEIGLATPFLERFAHRFRGKPQVWHSALSSAQRRETWKAVIEGKSHLVIGARSSLFLPFKNLGLIVVDEEHDSSYKQEDGPLYHARDMAVVRGQMERIPVILASATPALETRHNVEQGRYHQVSLTHRYGAANLPKVHLIDLRQTPPEKGQWIAPPLREAIKETLARGEQTLLFLNRRGYAPLTLCRTCGHRFECPDCSAWLIHHRSRETLQCHHCGHQIMRPKTCPSCQGAETLVPCGPGVERLAEEVESLFPGVSTLVLSSDTVNTPQAWETLIQDITQGAYPLIIGTQMLAKGHHFPKLTCVGVIDGDLGLAGGDLRAGEKTFQLLHQVSGRAGREDRPGHVFIQSYEPSSGVMRALVGQDGPAFYTAELKQRASAGLPPYGRLLALILSGPESGSLMAFAQTLKKPLDQALQQASVQQGSKLRLWGPAPAPLFKIRAHYRVRLLLQYAGRGPLLGSLVRDVLKSVTIPYPLKLKVDMDPQNFL